MVVHFTYLCAIFSIYTAAAGKYRRFWNSWHFVDGILRCCVNCYLMKSYLNATPQQGNVRLFISQCYHSRMNNGLGCFSPLQGVPTIGYMLSPCRILSNNYDRRHSHAIAITTSSIIVIPNQVLLRLLSQCSHGFISLWVTREKRFQVKMRSLQIIFFNPKSIFVKFIIDASWFCNT